MRQLIAGMQSSVDGKIEGHEASISRHTCYSHKCEPDITLYFLQQLASCLKPENMFKGERQ
jgi:hypothetical protein